MDNFLKTEIYSAMVQLNQILSNSVQCNNILHVLSHRELKLDGAIGYFAEPL